MDFRLLEEEKIIFLVFIKNITYLLPFIDTERNATAQKKSPSIGRLGFYEKKVSFFTRNFRMDFFCVFF